MNNALQYTLPYSRQQHGLTLVEILVALVLSLFLTAGIIQLFIGTKQSYRFHEALSRIQENGRFAIDRMNADIRMAGFGDPLAPINGTDATNAGNETDSISLAWVDGGGQTRNYAITPSTTTPACTSASTSLSLNSNGGGLQELIEGVQAMQILYGICADANNDNVPDGPPTNYVNATAASANWALVCSARIHLLLVSVEDNVVTQSQAYAFPIDTGGSLTTPTDRCLRQAFSTTVAIRNRLP